MQTFRLQLQQNSKLIITLVFVPIIAVGLFLFAMISLPELSEGVLIASICIFLILLVILVLWMLTRLLIQSCTISIDEEGLSYLLDSSSLFYRRSFSSKWENIKHIGEKWDERTMTRYLQIKFKKPCFTMTFNATPGGDDDADRFFEEVERYKNAFNKTHARKITRYNFFETGWARALTFAAYMLLLGLFADKFYEPNRLPWTGLISFGAVAVIWLGTYYSNLPDKITHNNS